MTDLQYETLRNELEDMRVPEGLARNLRWLASNLAIGRTNNGQFEVFICGDQLNSSSSLVQRHMQYGEWRPLDGGESFAANRVVLPESPHFASIAAVIAVELLRTGVAEQGNAQSAFADVEPIIEMAIRRGALPENVIVGLIGELTVLRQLLQANLSTPSSLLRVLDTWQGWQASGRDFRFGIDSLEVKTTQASSSIHKFNGLHQVEPVVLPDGEMERLSILSIGLSTSPTLGETLPQLVDDILAAFSGSPSHEVLSSEFLRRVALYGQSGTGYEHSAMRDWSVYRTSYVHTFSPRLFKLDDQAFALLTREMLSRTFVHPDDLSFTAHLPDQVSRFNPVPSWEVELQNMQNQNLHNES